MRALLSSIVIAVGLSACATGPLKFSVRFSDAESFKPSDPVLYQGDLIGQVEQVRLLQDRTMLDLRIDAREPQIRSTATFRLQPAGFFGGKRAVILEDPGTGEPIASGAVIRGYTRGEYAVESIRSAAGSVLESAREAVANAQKRIVTPEAQAFLDRLKQVAQEGGAALERFKEQAPEYRKELEALVERLRQAGQSEEAKSLEDAFDSLNEAE